MDELEARRILSTYHPDMLEGNDPYFDEALREAEKNPALMSWFEQEQNFDRAFATQLGNRPAPYGLKTRILAQATPATYPAATKSWSLAAIFASIAAVLFLGAQVMGLLHRSPATNMPDYSQEMVSFVKLPPPLEMQSSDLDRIKDWLVKENKPAMNVPPQLANLQPVGCRFLSYRGHDVTLVCFKRGDAQLAHLFIVDRAALPKMEPGDAPLFASNGSWSTACWAEKDRVYMIATEGDRAAVERYLPNT